MCGWRRREARRRVFIMKRDMEGFFLTELRLAGKTPVLLGKVPEIRGRRERDRVIYTVAGDFPESAAR
jgi:hypothetical protein